MNPFEELKENFSEIEKKLDFSFQNKELLILAFVHRSFVNENKKLIAEHNERLEFLGDAVLGAAVSEFLYKTFPLEPEGKLSFLRASLVDAASCAEYLQKLQLETHVLLGKGELFIQRGKKNILADAFEALIGAMYLDGGYEKVKAFIEKHVRSKLEEIVASPLRNYKADLQELSQRVFLKTPTYQVLKETGPDHLKIFHVAVFIGEKEIGLGSGHSKKEAEQMAAQIALRALEKKDE